MGRTAYFDEDSIARYFSNEYGNKLTFLALSILYSDYNWGSVQYDQDHIFPKDEINAKNLKGIGLNQEKIDEFISLRDSIGNLELLLHNENLEKHSKPLEKWLSTRDKSFMTKHLIPDDPNLWRIEKFDEFVIKRKEMISEKLKSSFGREY